MTTAEYLAFRMLKSLRDAEHTDPLETSLYLGEDTPARSRLALEIMAKALNTAKLVRVQRPVSKDGKTYYTHKWIKPGEVQGGDIVVGHKEVYEEWQKEQKASQPKTAQKSDQAEAKEKTPDPKAAISKIKSKNKKAKPKAVYKTKEEALAAKEKAEKQSETQTDDKAKAAPPEPEKQTQKTPKADPKPEKTPEPKAQGKKAQEAKKPEPKAEEENHPEPKADADVAAQLNPKPTKAAIFSTTIASQQLIADIYKFARLDESDTLVSEKSYKAATDALAYIQQKSKNIMESTVLDGVAALATQRFTAVYGQETADLHIEKAKQTSAYGYYKPEIIAAAMNAWTLGDAGKIRQRSIDHKMEEDPVNATFSKCLTDMIRHSDTVQKGTLYRGLHVKPSFLRQALETGEIKTRGLVSAAPDEETAQWFASKTGEGEVPVILELPESLGMKTLELTGAYATQTMEGKDPTECLLSTHGEFSVKSVTKDAGGVYHVELKPKSEALEGDLADDNTYAELGAKKPEKPDKNKIGPGNYKELLKSYGVKSYNGYYLESDVLGKTRQIYDDYGRDGVVEYLTGYATDNYNDGWAQSAFKDTKTGFDPVLIAFARCRWADGLYGSIRRMENKKLNSESASDSIYAKVFSDVLNALVEKDGEAQPETLMRGLNGFGDDLDKYRNAKVGEKITLGSISSFTTSLNVAKNFAHSDGVIFKLPKEENVSCAYVEGMSEAEYLVRNAEFAVASVETEGKHTVITLKRA